MGGTVRLQIQKALVLVLAVSAGCGSSNSKTEPNPDAAISNPDAAVPDASQKPDLENVAIKFDVAKPADTKIDTYSPPPDTYQAPAPDTAIGPTPDAFVPGPVEPLVVNSGNTAKYNLADGTWKVFSFDTVQGHFYVLGALADGVDAYVGQSSSVSPNEYMEKTNYLRALTFTANSGGKYYVAVAANGASASGSFQIADGGDLLELGENKVDLTAPNGEATTFYYFSVAPGHSYSISVTGAAKNPVTLSLSPLADRSTTGQFASPLSSKTSALPISEEPVPLESVAKSSSRLYFLYVKVQEAVSLTIKVDLAS
jgi:hypothetical protein